MKSLEAYIKLLENSIENFSLPAEPAHLYESISYLLAIGGKRIRPAAVLLACDVVGGKSKNALPVALAMEVFHNFTLMHDDIMDAADKRRGQPTVHVKWNIPTAILGGDAMLIKAYDLILNSVKPELYFPVFQLFNQTALEVCEGQQMDMNFESRKEVPVANYLEMIRLKTAVLLAACFKIGALLGNANEADANHLYAFGQDLGIAFQLKDDYLDCFGSEDFGKVKGGDILAGKKTILTLMVLEDLPENEKIKFLECLHGKSLNKVEEILAYYNEHGIGEKVDKLMDTYYQSALAHVDLLTIGEENKLILRAFAKELWLRAY